MEKRFYVKGWIGLVLEFGHSIWIAGFILWIFNFILHFEVFDDVIGENF